MSPAIRRILLLLLLVVVVVIIGLGLYYFFKKSQQTTTGGRTTGTTQQPGGSSLPSAGGREPGTGTSSTTQGSSQLPGSGTLPAPTGGSYYVPPAVTRVTSQYVSGASVSSQGGVRYYNQGDGKFYQTSPNGTVTALSQQTFYAVQNITWAQKKNEAVLQYPDGTNILYNFDTQKQVTLPKNWSEFTFSPTGDQVAAKSIGISADNNWLVAANADGSGNTLVAPMGENADKVIMSWSPSNQVVALSETGQPLGADRMQIIPVGLHNENLKALTVEGINFLPIWSPSGKELLYSVDSANSNFEPELWVTNAYGDNMDTNRHSLGLNTWASKCTFASDTTLYCAVPQTLPVGAAMEPAIAADTPDTLYRIDLTTGLKTTIPLDQDYTLDTLSYDSVTNKIMFTDHHKAGVFTVNL